MEYAIQVLKRASELFFPYGIASAGPIVHTRSTLSVSIELLNLFYPCTLRIDDDTIGMITGLQLFSSFNLKTDRKWPFPAFQSCPANLGPA